MGAGVLPVWSATSPSATLKISISPALRGPNKGAGRGGGAEDLMRETYTGGVAAARLLKPFVASHVDRHRVPDL
ncbi:hypothetical protein GCM10022295_81830 [Streptomyces osmaniensis]|uniref:Uncharacterized protein n=1 Tax=Streptomyces osmaniensis TaxID=593134 RepID=A0ABP6YPJ2_9ACTN